MIHTTFYNPHIFKQDEILYRYSSCAFSMALAQVPGVNILPAIFIDYSFSNY
jgi:hypothetical protein